MAETWQPAPGSDKPRVKPLYPEKEQPHDPFWDALATNELKPLGRNERFNALHPRDSKGRFMHKINVAPLVDVFCSPDMEDRVRALFDDLKTAGVDISRIADKHQLPKFESVKMHANGQYNHRTNTIKLNDGFTQAPFGNMVLAHEFGHFMDYKLLSDDPLQSGAATHKVEDASDEFAWLVASINMSEAAKSLEAKWKRANEGEDFYNRPNTGAGLQQRATMAFGQEKKYLSYLLTPTELFARAFMQYVARRAEPNLFEASYADDRLDRVPIARQWKSDDFQRIDLAFTTTLQANGWLSSQT